MNIIRNKDLTNRSQNLRKEMTAEEKHLWFDFLKHLPFQFKRQKIIGNYIADFYCAQAKLVIELDGAQHYHADSIAYDNTRNEYMKDLGLTVLRYTNLTVNTNFEGVCRDILKHLKENAE